MDSTTPYLILLCAFASAAAVQQEDNRLYGVIRKSVISEEVGRQSNGSNLNAVPLVAFSVYLSTSTFYSANQAIKFDLELMKSAGSGYDKTTGIFTAPISGVYLLSFIVGSSVDKNEKASVGLFVNGKVKIIVEGCQGSKDNYFCTVTGVTMLGLKKGDEAMLAPSSHTQCIIGSRVEAETTFSAILQHVI